MAVDTQISWTDATWNPIYGCSRVSEGCRNCYAEEVVAGLGRKLKGEAGELYRSLVVPSANGPRWAGRAFFHEDRLLDPLHWRGPRRVFVNSLSDLFHETLSAEVVARIFAVMALAPRHTFQVLTKRPERMSALLARPDWPALVQSAARSLYGKGGVKWSLSDLAFDALARPSAWPLSNVWLGVSVENQAAAEARIPLLLKTPAAVRWLSCEPLLERVDVSRYLWGRRCPDPNCEDSTHGHDCQLGAQLLHWVVVGGESGPGRRPFLQQWSDSLQDQCARAGVPFFFKQHGAARAGEVRQELLPGGRLVRQFPAVEVSRG